MVRAVGNRRLRYALGARRLGQFFFARGNGNWDYGEIREGIFRFWKRSVTDPDLRQTKGSMVYQVQLIAPFYTVLQVVPSQGCPISLP